jgi:hypothetical protein
MRPETIELLVKMIKAKTEGSPEKLKELEAEMTAYLVKTRDDLPADHSTRHMINFHFAAQALHEALVREQKMMAAQALSSFIPQFVKICALDSWLSGDALIPKDDVPGS